MKIKVTKVRTEVLVVDLEKEIKRLKQKVEGEALDRQLRLLDCLEQNSWGEIEELYTILPEEEKAHTGQWVNNFIGFDISPSELEEQSIFVQTTKLE